MNSLIPRQLSSPLNMSGGRIELAGALSSVITHLKVNSWPLPARPFIQMMVTFLEREHLKTLRLARYELNSVIQELEELAILEKEKNDNPSA